MKIKQKRGRPIPSAYSVEILEHTIAPSGGEAITYLLTYPLIVHAELMTHRQFSRNAASNRAIPIERTMESVIRSPFVPDRLPKSGKGMQPGGYYEGFQNTVRQFIYRESRWFALAVAWLLLRLGVHKEIANRVLVPWLWITVVVTTMCDQKGLHNFFRQRCHPDAQRQIRILADMMRAKFILSNPRRLEQLEWHLPFIEKEDYRQVYEEAVREWERQTGEHEMAFPLCFQDWELVGKLVKISAARCARTSFVPFDGMGSKSHAEDLKLHDQLVEKYHMSPLEHQLCGVTSDWQSNNVHGYRQYREIVENPSFQEALK